MWNVYTYVFYLQGTLLPFLLLLDPSNFHCEFFACLLGYLFQLQVFNLDQILKQRKLAFDALILTSENFNLFLRALVLQLKVIELQPDFLEFFADLAAVGLALSAPATVLALEAGEGVYHLLRQSRVLVKFGRQSHVLSQQLLHKFSDALNLEFFQFRKMLQNSDKIFQAGYLRVLLQFGLGLGIVASVALPDADGLDRIPGRQPSVCQNRLVLVQVRALAS